MSPRDEDRTNPPNWDEMIVKSAMSMMPRAARIEPSAEQREAANTLKGLFNSMREAGFTEDQTMKIVLGFIDAGRKRDGE